MRIGIQTWGSHGDIRPFLALAEGLQSAGHIVTLAITCVDSTAYNASTLKTNIKLQTIASPVIHDPAEYAAINTRILNETDPIKQVLLIIQQLFLPVEAVMYQAAEKLCAENDLVIGHFFHYPLQTAAEKMACPYISIMLVHSAIPSQLQPPAGLPGLGKLGNRLAWRLVQSMLNKHIKTFPDKLRAAHGLMPANDLVTDVWASHQLTLVAVSPEICIRPKDWPDSYQICGFLDMPNLSIEGQVSEELTAFLSNGVPPVYITFGSIMPNDLTSQKKVLSLLSKAVEIARCRAIIQAPSWQACQFTHTPMIHYVASAPHSAVFPHCQLIIHHGGAGTTQAASLAGKPSIVVAHIAEQAFWGRALQQIGIAPKVLFRNKLSAKQLAKHINQVMHSEIMREKAIKIGAAMRKEQGVDQAIKLINDAFPFPSKKSINTK